MLDLRPTCEHCNKSLPPDATDAMICTFECTFCKDCVTHLFENVCPNCGGGFVPRPIRPKSKLSKYPPSEKVVYKPVNFEKYNKLKDSLKNIPPEQR